MVDECPEMARRRKKAESLFFEEGHQLGVEEDNWLVVGLFWKPEAVPVKNPIGSGKVERGGLSLRGKGRGRKGGPSLTRNSHPSEKSTCSKDPAQGPCLRGMSVLEEESRGRLASEPC